MSEIVDKLRTYYQNHPEVARFLPPPASPAAVEAAEAKLGFALPPLLRELYLRLANGGFGPVAIGLEGGMPDYNGQYLPDIYLLMVGVNPEDPEQYWPTGWIPLFEEGCGSWTCIDCTQPEAPVMGIDPNVYDPDEGAPWSEALIDGGQSLEEMVAEWLELPEEWLKEWPAHTWPKAWSQPADFSS